MDGSNAMASKVYGSNSLNLLLTQKRTDNQTCNPEVKGPRSQSVHPLPLSLCQSKIQLNESMKGINKPPKSVEISG